MTQFKDDAADAVALANEQLDQIIKNLEKKEPAMSRELEREIGRLKKGLFDLRAAEPACDPVCDCADRTPYGLLHDKLCPCYERQEASQEIAAQTIAKTAEPAGTPAPQGAIACVQIAAGKAESISMNLSAALAGMRQVSPPAAEPAGDDQDVSGGLSGRVLDCALRHCRSIITCDFRDAGYRRAKEMRDAAISEIAAIIVSESDGDAVGPDGKWQCVCGPTRYAANVRHCPKCGGPERYSAAEPAGQPDDWRDCNRGHQPVRWRGHGGCPLCVMVEILRNQEPDDG